MSVTTHGSDVASRRRRRKKGEGRALSMDATTTMDVGTSVVSDAKRSDDLEVERRRRLVERYMATMFPLEAVVAMVSACAPIANREFAFMGRRRGRGETEHREPWVSRNQSFSGSPSLRDTIRKKAPFRMEIGAAWTVEPRHAKVMAPATGRIAARELVFDIDIDEYDLREDGRRRAAARTCCSGARWCRACWPILAIGCSILDAALEDMGAKNVGWFYSGRRGMHCWVVDPALASPAESAREATAWFVAPTSPASVVEGAAARDPIRERMLAIARDRFLRWYAPRHPGCAFEELRAASVRRKCPTVHPDIEAAIAAASAADASLNHIRSETDATIVVVDTEEARIVSTGIERLVTSASSALDPWHNGAFDTIQTAIAEAALSCLLPRTDPPVTIQPNHLLRAPMSVNADTLRLGVFVPRSRLLDFLPSSVPTLVAGRDGDRATFDDDAAATSSLSEFVEWIKTLSP
jgi:DNA primase small subunit